MSFITSKDGTKIGFSVEGVGPALILVDGAMCYRAGNSPMPKLAALLRDTFTVYTYDRRGRGESGDNESYEIQREIEDIEALIDHAGGHASLYGVSSGALLAMYAANAFTSKVDKLAVYEAPLVLNSSRPPIPDSYVPSLQKAIADGKPTLAIQTFMKDAVGMPAFLIKLMPYFPGFSKGQKIAHTLIYDGKITKAATNGLNLKSDFWKNVSAQTLVIAGGKSQLWMRDGNEKLSKTFKKGAFQIIPGENHMLKPRVHAPILKAFLSTVDES